MRLEMSVETLRKVAECLWKPSRERDPRVHRPRRTCVGELIQIDGCDHEWFEERSPRRVLLVFVDDATSRLMELRFARSESTFEHFTSVQRYSKRHARPVAFYSDKATIFRVNRKDRSSWETVKRKARLKSRACRGFQGAVSMSPGRRVP
jgi:hypothetical protein